MKIIRDRFDLELELSSRYFYEKWNIGENWANRVIPGYFYYTIYTSLKKVETRDVRSV